MRSVRRFVPEEDAFIRKNRGRITLTAIARHLGRDPSSVVSRSATLGLHVPNRTVHKFSAAEDLAIREGAGKISMYQIAERLGRKSSSCYGRAARLGYKFPPAMRSATERREKDGYIWLPLIVGSKRHWRQEHRVAVERHLGRTLNRKELVHHVNLDRADNRLSNLYLCPSESRHSAIHKQLIRLLGGGEMVRRLLALGIITFDHVGGNYKLCETSS